MGNYQGQSAPADIVPPDGTGDGKKPASVTGAKVSTGQLMVKMGQVPTKKGGKEGGVPTRAEASKFEGHVRHEWLLPRHPQCIMGPIRLRMRRIGGRTGYELWEAAISDFISCYEEFLPLEQFDDNESIRHDWIHHFIRNLCNRLRETATGTEKAQKKKKKRKASGSSEEPPPKRPHIQVADIPNKSFVVRVRGDAVPGSPFHAFQGLEEFSELLKWIAKAKPKGPFTLETNYRCQLSEEAAQDAGVTAGEEFVGEVWNQDTWNAEVQNFRAVAPEAGTLLLQANLWTGEDDEDRPENVLLVQEPKKGTGVSYA